MDTKVILSDSEIPDYYLNLNFYLNEYLKKIPDQPLNPKTRSPLRPQDLIAIFPRELIKQETSMKEKILIPDRVRQLYKLYRPSPLLRAKRLEEFLQTPARIYYKHEGVSPSGSHKLNTALAQAYYNRKEGVKCLVTETGAGQWGSALSMATAFFGLKCLVFMVKISFEQKPYRQVIMKLFGAQVLSSPSKTTVVGQRLIKKFPNTSGSLGMAISEALETVIKNNENRYALGSVLNHVLMHQTIIGQEAQKQMEIAGDYPDVVIGCCGGGSNFAGLVFPFLIDKLRGKKTKTRFVGVEPESCASMCKGKYRYDYADIAKLTPLLKMETLGVDFVPPAFHAGGLRYHGIAPQLAFLHRQKLIEARSYRQQSIFKAAQLFAKTEGIIVAPESAHAVKAAIDEAQIAKEAGEMRIILFNLSGHGLLDLKGYDDYLTHKLK